MIIVLIKPLKNVFHSLAYNLKPLLFFEVLYRLFGIFLIYPLMRIIFHLAIRLSGHRFITNNLLIDFLFLPSTIILGIVLLIILSIYIVIELTFLALLFDLGFRKEHVSLKNFMFLGIRRVAKTFMRYHVFIIVPSFFFLLIIQSINLVGVSSTIAIPPYLIAQLQSFPGFTIAFYVLIFCSFIIFIETIFSIHLFTIEKKNFKDAYRESRIILKKKRLKMIGEFLWVNGVVNVALYLIYFIIILLIGVFITITQGQEYVLGFLLTILYSTYSFIGLVATLILVPINFSLISTWYYDYKEKHGYVFRTSSNQKLTSNQYNLKWIKLGSILTLILLFGLNITTIFSAILDPSDYAEIFSYPEIVAHRGASKDAPENTLASIELAIEQGADIVEFDVQLTRDNVIVLMHDYTLRRTTNLTTNTRLDSLNYADIANLDAGSWFSAEFEGEKIPTLIESLDLIDKRVRVFIDVKTNSSIMDQQLVQTLEIFDMVEHAVVLSKSRAQLVRIKALNPEIKTLLLLSSFYGDQGQLILDDVIDYYGLEQRFVLNNLGIIKDLQSKGKKVYAWTVSEPHDMERIMGYGLDGMITARPYIAREVIYSYRTSKSLVQILTQLFQR